MANTKISEIANGIALGENRFTESQVLDEAAKAGEVVTATATGVALTLGVDGIFLGVVKEHEEFDLDTDITLGKEVDIVTEGYCAVFVCDILDTKYPGTLLYTHYDTPGSLRLTANATAAAKLLRTIHSGDTVAIVKLLR